MHSCIRSLVDAYRYFSRNNDKQLARLFLIKNFLVLKDQLNSFDIHYACIEAGVDLRKVWDSVREWRSNLRGVLQLVYETFPKFITNAVDTRQELNQQLRVAVNGYIETAVIHYTECLSIGNLESITEFQNRIQKFPELRQQISLYLSETWIIELFLQAIREEVVSKFQNFYESIVANEDITGSDHNKSGTTSLKHLNEYVEDIYSVMS